MKKNVKARPIPTNIALWGFILLALIIFVLAKSGALSEKKIDSYESCVAAGHPVLESYPERCVYQGKSYVNPVLDVKHPYE
jgi:hypothetical protein